MKSFLLFFVLSALASVFAAEFPNINSHIQLSWLGTDMTNKIDSNQTVSVNGSVRAFTFCGEFNPTDSLMICYSDFSYKVETGDREISGSGNGNKTRNGFISEEGSRSCWRFDNFIPNFKEVYSAAEIGQGSWKHTWNCSEKYVAPKSSAWPFVLGFIGFLIFCVVLGFAFYKYDQEYPEKTKQVKDCFRCCCESVCQEMHP